MFRSPLAIVCAALLLPGGAGRAQKVPDPPLPGEEGTVSSTEAFSLFPGPGEEGGIPPESIAPEEALLPEARPGPQGGIPNPVQPPPNADVDTLPEVDAPGLPSDGEEMPEMPAIPGLVLPRFKKQATPGEGTVPPGGKETSGQDLLPAPNLPGNLQWATRAFWHTSPHVAMRKAEAEGKPLLIVFEQPGKWDGSPTVLMRNDLLSNAEFSEFAASRLVLVSLYYPVGSPGRDYSDAKLEALAKFKEYFKVTGFPTIIMVDSNRRELLRLKGYRRVDANGVSYSNKSQGVAYSTAHVMLDQIKEAEKRFADQKRYRQERVDNLTSQGYRMWTSRTGSTMMGKLVEAKAERIILKDENGRWRQVKPGQLILFDEEWARRKQGGQIPARPPETVAGAPDPLSNPLR